MIGIPMLDDLSEQDMISIVRGEKRVCVYDIRKKQLFVSYIEEPQPMHVLSLMDNDKVITLLKMELASRLNWLLLKDKLDKINKVSI